jgi:hypothetical protein
MAAQRKAPSAPPPSLPPPSEPAAALPPPAPVISGESAQIYQQHQTNLAGLRSELAEVTKLREKSGVLLSEVAKASELIDGMADDLLEGHGSNEELGKAKARQDGLEAQLSRLHKRQHAAELSLQRRLSADIRAIARLEGGKVEGGWIRFQLDRETERIAQLVLEDRRSEFLSVCGQLAEVSKSYAQTISRLGERALESFAWSRPLDNLVSEKTPWSTQHIPDAVYRAVTREEIIGPLLETAAKAIRRWEVLLGLVHSAAASGFQLPSYEQPTPVQELPPSYPDSTRATHAFWMPADLEKPPHEVATFTDPKTGKAA